MASDKTASSGLFLPKWMMSKFGDRGNINVDDSFLSEFDHSGWYYHKCSESESQLENKDIMDPSQQTTMKRSSTAPDAQFKAAAAAVAEENSGQSIYSVAQNLFSGKFFGNYSSDKSSDEPTYQNRGRRNSKSLPSSPLNSRRVFRKNPYFTDPFVKPDEQFDGKSLLYLSIYSPRRSLENLIDPPSSTSSSPKIPRSESKGHLVPKPSELRELNCWSPISM